MDTPMTLTFNTASSSSVKIPLFSSNGSVTATIDWGDGTGNTISTSSSGFSKTYATVNTFNVSVWSSTTNIILGQNSSTPYGGDGNQLLRCTSLGSLNIISMEKAFGEQYSLTVVPSSIPSTVTSLSQTFFSAGSLIDTSINSWNTTNVVNMANTFAYCYKFNTDISGWNVSNVTDMNNMFYRANAFNKNIGNWNVSNVTDMNNMFYRANAFNKNIGNWNTEKVMNMSNMFNQIGYNGTAFANGGSTLTWNTSNVTDMNSMFRGTVMNNGLNMTINFDTSKVKNMAYMFYSCGFQGRIDTSGNYWNVSNVTTMNSMFYAGSFNQDISGWVLSSCTDMSQMFRNCNGGTMQNINWDCSGVQNMSNMFSGFTVFNANISNWNISNVADMTGFLNGNSGMSRYNFTILLIRWASRPVKPNVTFNAPLLKYFSSASDAYTTLTTAPNSWTITTAGVEPKTTPTLSNFNVPVKKYLDASFSITAPSSNNTDPSGTFSYISGNTSVATVSGSIITIVGVGSSIITSTQALTIEFNSASIDASFTVNKANPSFSTFTLPVKNYLDASFSITSPISNNTDPSGTFSYVSGNTSVATVSGSIITIVGIGNTYIRATQAATNNFNSLSIDASFTVTKLIPSFSTFTLPVKNYLDASFGITDPISNNTDPSGTFSYVSGNTSVATVSGNTITINGAGNTYIRATQAETTNFESNFIDASFTVNKLTPTLSNFSILTKTYGDAPFTISIPTTTNTDSSTNFTYVSGNTSVATVSGNTITIIAGGNINIRATQESTANFNSNFIDASFTVNRIQTSMPGTFIIPSKNVGDVFSLTSTDTNIITNTLATDNPGFPIVYTSSDIRIASIDVNNNITILGPGNCTITASQTTDSMIKTKTVNLSVNSMALVYTITTNNTQIILPLYSANFDFASNSGSTITALINWGDNSNITSVSSYTGFYKTFNIGTYYIYVHCSNTNLRYGFDYGDYRYMTFQKACTSFGNLNLTSLKYAFVGMNHEGGITSVPSTLPSSVRDISYIFKNNHMNDSNISTWNTSNVTNMEGAFTGAINFNQNIGSWNTINVVNMNNMFSLARSFNQNIGSWNTGNVINMNSMFREAYVFNQNIGSWNTSNVTDMAIIFYVAKVFNQNIGSWNTINVKDMNNMFGGGGQGMNFNQPIGNWNTSNVTNMYAMFAGSTRFNQPIGNWNVSNVSNMNAMFANAPFDQNISTWNVSNVSNMTDIFTNSNLSVYNFTILLIGWASRPVKPNVTLSASSRSHTSFASSAYTTLTSSPNNWTITRGTVIMQTTPTLTFTVLTKKYLDASFSLSQPTSTNTDPSGTFTYVSGNTSVAGVSGSAITIIGAGNTYIRATQAATVFYYTNYIDASFIVNKITPALSSFSLQTKNYLDASFTITKPTTTSLDSSTNFSYVSGNTSVATVSGSAITIIGAGNSTIKAIQSATNNYYDTSINVVFTVNKLTPDLSSFAIETKNYLDASFTITKPTTTSLDSSTNFTYVSGNASVATVSGSAITITGAGNTTIKATQLASNNYNDTSINAVFTVNKITPDLSNFAIETKNYLDASFTITKPTTTSLDSSSNFIYVSGNTSVATISGNTITVLLVGNTTITATQSATSNYNDTSINAVFTVNKITPDLSSFAVQPKNYLDASFTITKPTTTSLDSSTNFSYVSGNTSVATISGNTINVLLVGNTTITATQSATSNYNDTSINTVFTVNKITPDLSSFAIETKNYLDASFTITKPTTTSLDSSTNFSYVSGNTSVATISGNTITVLLVGNTTITATQSATSNYNDTSINTVFTVNKITPDLSSFSIQPKNYLDASFIIPKPTTTSLDSSTNFSYVSGNTSVATVSGSAITITGAGSTTITSIQPATSNYNDTSINTVFTVNKLTPDLSSFSIQSKNYLDASFTITKPTTTSLDSSINFSYVSGNTSVATISGNTITVLLVGNTTITATQSETSNYNDTSINAVFTVNKITPDLSSFAIQPKNYLDASFTITKPTTTSLDSSTNFTYVSGNTSVATVSGSAITITGAGSTTIKAIQPATNNYNDTSINTVFTVNKLTPDLSSFAIETKNYLDASFTITKPTTTSLDSSTNFTYVSGNTSVATVSGSAITITGAGSTTIKAIQPATNNYNDTSINAVFTVNKLTPDLSSFAVQPKNYLDASFTITKPTTTSLDSSTNFSYVSGNTTVATISGNTITVLSVGNTTITATQPATNNYNGNSINTVFTVNKITPDLSSFSIQPKNYLDASFTITKPTTTSLDSSTNFTYVSGNTSVATVSGSAITITGAGNTTITATQPATNNYNDTSINTVFTVNKLTPDLSSFSIQPKNYLDASFTITKPTTTSLDSSNNFTYVSGNTSVATISGNTITVLSVGSTTITATQPATNNYNDKSINTVFTVNKITPDLSSFAIQTKNYLDASFTITKPTTTSLDSSTNFTYVSGNTSVATVSGSAITITGAGSTTITATQSATANYNGTSINAVFTVNKLTPDLSSFAVQPKNYLDASFTITKPTTTSLDSSTNFSYVSGNTSVATISGNTITVLSVGNTTITATQPATNNYNGNSINTVFTVNKITPDLSSFAVQTKNYLDASFTITKPTTTSLDSSTNFTYVSGNTSVATVSGSAITITGAGSTTIKAIQPATNNYNDTSINTVFTVNKLTPDLSSFSIQPKNYLDASFTITKPTTTSLDSSTNFTYVSGNTSVATISGNTITVLSVGNTTITATQSATANYNANSINTVFIVNKITPDLSSFAIETKNYLDASFTITKPTTTSLDSSTNFTYVSGNASVATVSGSAITITGAGSTTITSIQPATNNYNDTSINTVFTVNKLTPDLSSFAIQTKNYLDASFTITKPTTTSLDSSTNFSYVSGNTSVATISGNTITVLSVGNTTITATQPATNNYNGNSINTVFTVNKITPDLSSFAVQPKNYLDASFTITKPTTTSLDSSTNFTYVSGNTSVATVSGSAITVLSVGNTTITATQSATANYNGTSINTIFTVNKITPDLSSFSIQPKNYLDASFTITKPTTTSLDSSTNFTYVSGNTSVATVSGNTITVLLVGNTTITATQSATNNYNGTSINTVFTVNKITPDLSSFAIQTKNYLDASFTITKPTTTSLDSSTNFTYVSGNTSVATVSGSAITITGAGSTTITSTQLASNNYNDTSINAVFTVNKITPDLSSFAVQPKNYLDASFTITKPTTTSLDSSANFSYVSGNTSVATVSGNTITVLLVGNTTITATQSATANYNGTSINTVFTVNKITPALSSFAIQTKNYLDSSFAITKPTTTSLDSSTNFTYISGNTSVATVSGNSITIIGAGSSTITSTQSATANYNDTSINAVFTVNKLTPDLSSFAIETKNYLDASFIITKPTTTSLDSSTNFTYVSGNTSVATVSGSAITITGAGSTTITSTQLASNNYNDTSINAVFTVNKITPDLSSFSIPTKNYLDASFTITKPTTTSLDSSSNFSYVSGNTSVATISGNTITVLSVGNTTITATQSATNNYNDTSINAVFTVNKITPALSSFTVPTKNYLDASFIIPKPTTTSLDSSTNFTYVSGNTSVATVSGNTITVLLVGTTTITATQSATSNYNDNSINAVFTVNKITPALSSFTVPTKNYLDASFTITKPTTTSLDSSTNFSYVSGNTSVATISGNTISVLSVGTTTITATQSPTANYNDNSINTVFTVNKITPALSSFTVPTKNYLDASFIITHPTTTSLDSSTNFTYISGNTSVATISGNTITITGAGNTTITSTQLASNNYNDTSINAVFTVNKITPVVSNFSIQPKNYLDASFIITHPTTTSLDSSTNFTYVSGNTSVATVSGNTITITGVGTTTITSTQLASNNYNNTSINTVFTVNKINPTLGTFTVPVKNYLDASFSITDPSSNNTDPSGTFSYVSGNTSVATVSGKIITIVGGGSTTITATQSATNNFNLLSTSTTFTVNKINPTFSAFTVPVKNYKDAKFSVSIPTTTDPSGIVSIVSGNTSVATVVGNIITIVGAGTTYIRASQSATNNYNSLSIDASFTVNKITPILSKFVIPIKAVGSNPVIIKNPASPSTGTFSYTSSDTNVATINRDIITIVGAGTSIITATQEATDNYNAATITASFIANTPIPCFKHDSKILCFKQGKEQYIKIQDIRKGDLVKTSEHGYLAVDMIGKRDIYHPASQERIKNQLYKCSKSKYAEIFEDLIITGCHCILVDDFINEEQRKKTFEVCGDIYVTDYKYRIPSCVDERSSVYETPGTYTIYHFALENHDYYMNYGIYANGLLVETSSKRYMKELSGLTFTE